MAWNAFSPTPSSGRPSPTTRKGRLLGLLLLAPMVAGCETMERMDYFDRFFEAGPRSGPIVATGPVAHPADHAPAPERDPQLGLVRAMEPISNPADYAAAADRSPQPSPARAAEPRPGPLPAPSIDPEARTRDLVRQNPWVTRFWEELTPAEQSRVERQLQRGNVRLASGRVEPAAVWDPMGLADRVALVFGRGPSFERPAAPEQRNRPTLAGNS